MQHTCLICKEEFKAKAKNRRYCSKVCFNARNKHLTNRECLICRAVFISYPNWIKRGGGKYCSTKCGAVARDKKVERVCLKCGINFRLKPSKIVHNYECKICNMSDEEHILIYGYHLNIHHIDYIKKNSFIDNLIALCHQCHGITNYNREYWQDYFLTKKEK